MSRKQPEAGSNGSLGRRLAAMLYDGLLVLALWFLGTVPFVMALDKPVDPGDRVYQIVLVLIVYVFFVGFWTRYGRTLGMQSWELRIETEDGDAPSIAQGSLRFVTALLSLGAAGLGFFWQLVDPLGLSWHDRLSGTRIRFYPRESD